MKKIFKVSAHDTNNNEQYSSFYTTAESKEEFLATLVAEHDNEIEVDDIVEYSIDAIVDLLNLHLD